MLQHQRVGTILWMGLNRSALRQTVNRGASPFVLQRHAFQLDAPKDRPVTIDQASPFETPPG